MDGVCMFLASVGELIFIQRERPREWGEDQRMWECRCGHVYSTNGRHQTVFHLGLEM